MGNSRRDFVKVTAGLGITAAMRAAETGREIPRRPLGRTGLEVSIMGLGGARIGTLLDNQAALDIVRRCYDLGVSYSEWKGQSTRRKGLADRSEPLRRSIQWRAGPEVQPRSGARRHYNKVETRMRSAPDFEPTRVCLRPRSRRLN